MLLAHIAFCIPYVMLSVMPKIRSLDPNLADAAMDLGANALEGADESYCSTDYAGYCFRSTDRIHHVSG